MATGISSGFPWVNRLDRYQGDDKMMEMCRILICAVVTRVHVFILRNHSVRLEICEVYNMYIKSQKKVMVGAGRAAGFKSQCC